jgi:hypothetical protein
MYLPVNSNTLLLPGSLLRDIRRDEMTIKDIGMEKRWKMETIIIGLNEFPSLCRLRLS